MTSIIILGAGLSGLSSAYHLEKNKFFDYKLFEKEEIVGGLCRSEVVDGFTFDYTGHLIHINDQYFKGFVEEVLNFQQLNEINRKSFIYSCDTFTNYPFQTNLYGLPIAVIKDCIIGFLKRKSSIRTPQNFYNWVLKHFGKGIGKYFLFPYNKKLWQCDLKKMHWSWTGRFVPSTTLESMIEGAIEVPTKRIGYNSVFYYPKNGGIQYFPNQIAKKLQNPINTNHCVEKVDLINKKVFFKNGHQEEFDVLISTLPLDNFLKISRSPTNFDFSGAIKNLKCNSLVNFNLGLAIPNVSEKHWIYFPEKKYNFYRIGFWSNFSKSLARENCSSIYGEFTYMPQTLSPKQIQHISDKSISQVVEILGLKKDQIITQKLLHINHAYVTYDMWREKNLNKLLNQLTEISVFSIGRFGSWKYSSMQEAILDGKEAIEKILKQKIVVAGASKTTLPKIHPASSQTQIFAENSKPITPQNSSKEKLS